MDSKTKELYGCFLKSQRNTHHRFYDIQHDSDVNKITRRTRAKAILGFKSRPDDNVVHEGETFEKVNQRLDRQRKLAQYRAQVVTALPDLVANGGACETIVDGSDVDDDAIMDRCVGKIVDESPNVSPYGSFNPTIDRKWTDMAATEYQMRDDELEEKIQENINRYLLENVSEEEAKQFALGNHYDNLEAARCKAKYKYANTKDSALQCWRNNDEGKFAHSLYEKLLQDERPSIKDLLKKSSRIAHQRHALTQPYSYQNKYAENAAIKRIDACRGHLTTADAFKCIDEIEKDSEARFVPIPVSDSPYPIYEDDIAAQEWLKIANTTEKNDFIKSNEQFLKNYTGYGNLFPLLLPCWELFDDDSRREELGKTFLEGEENIFGLIGEY